MKSLRKKSAPIKDHFVMSESTISFRSDCAKYEPLGVHESDILMSLAQNGDKNAIVKLVNHNLRLVYYIASFYANDVSKSIYLNFDDLLSEGRSELVNAIVKNTGNWTSANNDGIPFSLFISKRIQGKIVNLVCKNKYNTIISITASRTIDLVKKATRKVANEIGIDPSAEDIIEKFESFPQKNVCLRIGKNPYHNELDERKNIITIQNVLDFEKPVYRLGGGYSRIRNIEDESEFIPQVEDLLIDNTYLVDKKLDQESLELDIERSLSTLTKRESEVIKYIFGLEGRTPLEPIEIGKKFDLTRERIRQIKEKAIRRLKHTSRSRILKKYIYNTSCDVFY